MKSQYANVRCFLVHGTYEHTYEHMRYASRSPKPGSRNFSPNVTVLVGSSLQRPPREFAVVKRSVSAQWAALDDHFRHHAKLVNRFRHADVHAVARMWKSQTNEDGKRLSPFERDALIERHCELFGTWPH